MCLWVLDLILDSILARCTTLYRASIFLKNEAHSCKLLPCTVPIQLNCCLIMSLSFSCYICFFFSFKKVWIAPTLLKQKEENILFVVYRCYVTVLTMVTCLDWRYTYNQISCCKLRWQFFLMQCTRTYPFCWMVIIGKSGMRLLSSSLLVGPKIVIINLLITAPMLFFLQRSFILLMLPLQNLLLHKLFSFEIENFKSAFEGWRNRYEQEAALV